MASPRISSTDLRVRTTLRVSIIDPERERVNAYKQNFISQIKRFEQTVRRQEKDLAETRSQVSQMGKKYFLGYWQNADFEFIACYVRALGLEFERQG